MWDDPFSKAKGFKGYSYDYIEIDGVRQPPALIELTTGRTLVNKVPYILVSQGREVLAYWSGMDARYPTEYVCRMKDGSFFKSHQKWRIDMTVNSGQGKYIGEAKVGY